jgi:flagellar transcriptional activator FlhC
MNAFAYTALSLPTPPLCAERADLGDCGVELCGYATKISESTHLIRLGARARLVSQLTGLEKTTVKRLYHQLCGQPSPAGQMPFSDTWYRDNDLRMLHATLVWRLHRRLTRTRRGAARVLIDLFEAYTQLKPEPLLDITRTAFVPHLVTIGTWHERLCEFCKMHNLSPVESNSIACRGCRLYYRYRCHQCCSPLVPQSRGRRRTICSHYGSALNAGIQP